MTVYGVSYDDDLGWYVTIMTPNGPKNQPVQNPLYYFDMMKVKPPVGAEFSEDDIADYQDLLNEENKEQAYDNLEPYQTLHVKSFSETLFKTHNLTQQNPMYQSTYASLLDLKVPKLSVSPTDSPMTTELIQPQPSTSTTNNLFMQIKIPIKPVYTSDSPYPETSILDFDKMDISINPCDPDYAKSSIQDLTIAHSKKLLSNSASSSLKNELKNFLAEF